MAIQLFIKSHKPFVEVKAKSKYSAEAITLGVAVYKESELVKVRKDFKNAVDIKKITRWSKELEALNNDTSLTEDEFDTKAAALETAIDEATIAHTKALQDFYKTHIRFIKNAALSVQDGDAVSDLNIPDTRDVKPVESLWDTPDECLAVLLDVYLDEPSFRDSLQEVITNTVFNINFKNGEVKN